MEFHRRDVLYGIGAIGLAGWPHRAMTRTALQIGQTRITSVSDGHLVLPGSMMFEGLPQDELTTILNAAGVSQDQLQPPCNLTLVQRDDAAVLFDAGSGHAFMESAGTILDSLDALDVAAEDITHVVMTHAHPDHLWGVLDDFDDPVFSEATHLIGQSEWDYWINPETVDTIGEARASFAVGASRRLAAIEDQLDFITPAQEILPGILAHGTPGHTPGHMSFEIRDGSESVLVVGDAIGNHHIAFARPEWPSGTDQDTELGAKTRMALLDQLATDRMTLVGFHLPEGGMGRVERRGDAYQFVPEGS